MEIARDLLFVLNYVPIGSLVVDLGYGVSRISVTLSFLSYFCIGMGYYGDSVKINGNYLMMKKVADAIKKVMVFFVSRHQYH